MQTLVSLLIWAGICIGLWLGIAGVINFIEKWTLKRNKRYEQDNFPLDD